MEPDSRNPARGRDVDTGIYGTKEHLQDWVNAIRSREKPISVSACVGPPSGDLAYRTGQVARLEKGCRTEISEPHLRATWSAV